MRRWWRSAAGVLGLLCTCAAHAQALPAIHLVPELKVLALDPQVQVLRDDSGRWGFGEVSASPLADRFAPPARKTINYGYTTAAYWYRFRLRSDMPGVGNSDWVLELDYPPLDRVDIYVAGQTGLRQTVLAGDQRQISAALLSHRSVALPLSIEPGEELMLYLRVQTEGSHQVPMLLWSAREFTQKSTLESLGFGLFFGVLLVMALYNFFILVFIREPAYFWYISLLVTFAGLQLDLDGLMYQFLQPVFAITPRLINQGMPVLICAPVISGLMFSRTLLQTQRNTPRSNVAISVVIVLLCACIALTAVLSYSVVVPASAVLGALGAITSIMAGVNALRAGVRAARTFLLAWSFFMFGILVKVTELFGVLPTSFFTAYTWQIGALMLVTLLSVALADRINQERKERFDATESANRLKSFLPQRVADLVMQGAEAGLLEPKRRQVTVCLIDLRGFTPFSETAAPEEVMSVLREFFDVMGKIVEQHGGTVEHFAGDSMLVFFNAPIEIPFPERQAVLTAIEMRAAFASLRQKWARLGHELGLGIGIAEGYATIGAIGFAGRSQYAAIGAVTNLASRLCSSARHGEILATTRVLATVEGLVEAESAGEQSMKGFQRPFEVVRIAALKQTTAADGGAGSRSGELRGLATEPT